MGTGGAIKGIPASHLNLTRLPSWGSSLVELIAYSEKAQLLALSKEISSNTLSAYRTNKQEHLPEVLSILLPLSYEVLSSPFLS